MFDQLPRRTFLKQTMWALSIPFVPGIPGLFREENPLIPADLSPHFHLTAHPWSPLSVQRSDVLDIIEGLCRFSIQHQDDRGAIIDPVIHREHQYATPYFAYALGTLLHAGRALDLSNHGLRAMDHATLAVDAGNEAIPDHHGEFFIAPLTGALSLYEGIAEEVTLKTWKERLSRPVSHIIESVQMKTNNWRTYAMKGEWLRAASGLISREEAIAFIEDGWLNRTQRERIQQDLLHLYQDWNGHPQSHAVEAVGRGNLLALIEAGYNGPSAESIEKLVEAGTAVTLLLQDPTGQCPPNGRTDNHIFNDVLYQLIFEAMAEKSQRRGEARRASQYRRAANLAFRSIMRWRREDDPWTGSFYITKNHFDPSERIGYQPASQYSNYSGAVMYHLAEAYHTRASDIPEEAAPAEIGGYAFAMDERFGSVVANAGGLHVFVNTRGDSVPKYDTFWTPLGVVRISRVNWDSRLGPSDGARDFLFEEAVSFAPTWKDGSQWKRLAMESEHYQGTPRFDFVHPLIVKFSILYAPITGVGGPNFFHDVILTPDGVFSTLYSPHEIEFGATLPLLEDDGRLLNVQIEGRIASTSYPEGVESGDEQHFLAVNNEPVLLEPEESVLSTYGWLQPVRATTNAERLHLFTYPRSQADPPAQEVLSSFKITEQGFSSTLGRQEDSLYVGRYAAGGFGNSLDLNGDGTPDVTLATPCGFIVQHESGQILAIETDSEVKATVQGEALSIQPFTPLLLG